MPRIRQCPGSTVPLVEVAPGGLNCATVICVGVSGKFVRVARLTHALTGSERASAPKLVCAPKPARDAPARSLASTENGRRGVAGECPDFIRTSRIWLVRSRAGDTRNVTRRRQKVTCRRPCPAAQLLRPALPPSARARSIFEIGRVLGAQHNLLPVDLRGSRSRVRRQSAEHRALQQRAAVRPIYLREVVSSKCGSRDFKIARGSSVWASFFRGRRGGPVRGR